jgi:hypothetical protein
VLSAIARDAAGNTEIAANRTVTVFNPDITAPTVAITAPLDATNVWGRVPVIATASDVNGVVGVQFKLDGVNLHAEDLTEPFEVIWQTFFLPEGAHTLTAVARDGAGNTSTSAAIAVTVHNNPTGVSLTAASVITFGTNPTTVSITAVGAPPSLGNPSGVSLTATGVPGFLANPSVVSFTAEGGSIGFLAEPSLVTITLP